LPMLRHRRSPKTAAAAHDPHLRHSRGQSRSLVRDRGRRS
jgi:hypothetical protein